MHEPRAVVVGGGLAGLAAAFGLREAGFTVTVLERDREPGGRAASERVDGLEIDTAATLLWTSDVHTTRLLRAVGLEGSLLPLRPVALAQVHHGALHPIDPVGLRGVARVPGVRVLDALRSARLARLLGRHAARLDSDRPERGAVLDDRSVADFAKLYFGESVLERWIAPALENTTLCDPEQTSRLRFLQEQRAHGFAFPGTPRGGGIARLAAALAARVRILAGTRAVQVVERSDRRLSVHPADPARPPLLAEAVVLATRAPDAATLAAERLTHPERVFLGSVRYLPAIVLAAAVEGRLAGRSTRVRVPRAEGWPVAAIGLEPGGPGERVPEGRELALLVARAEWSGAHPGDSDEAVARALLPCLERLFPGATERVAVRRVYRHPEGLPRFDVGAFRAIAGFQRVQEDLRREGRRLYFAGDYLVAPSVEGALASGLRAARAAAEDLHA